MFLLTTFPAHDRKEYYGPFESVMEARKYGDSLETDYAIDVLEKPGVMKPDRED